MKRLIAIPAITVLFLASCSKFREHIPEDIGKCCRIQSVTVNVGQAVQRFDFSYDSAGNPVSIISQLQTQFQYLDLHMLYDENGKLKAYYDSSGPMWQSYTYPSPNTIIDSFSYFPDPGSFLYATTITLDSKGRAVRYSRADVGSTLPPDVTDISYDSRGNAIIPGATYDNKINPLQTSKPLQLIGRDYSRNNPIDSTAGSGTSPAAYNRYGLPTKFKYPSNFMRQLLFFWGGYDSLSIKYSCDKDSGGIAK